MFDKSFEIIGGGYGRYDVIDFLKGFSITTIVIMHLIQNYIAKVPGFLITASSLGGTGVHVFIFCSGFGLYLSYLNRKRTYAEFITARFTKIYLPYICVVWISYLIPFMYSGNDRMMALFSHVFLFKMFVERYEGSFGGQLWFISTIIQFYLLFIPLCKLRDKCNSPKCFAILSVIASVFWWLLVAVTGKQDIRVWNSFFLQYLWEFSLGMLIAEYLYSGGKIRIRVISLAAVSCVGIGLQAVLALKGNVLKLFNDIPALFGYGTLALLIYSCGIFNKLFKWLSKISFEWFLLHILVFEIAFRIIAPQTFVSEMITGVFSIISGIVLAWGYNKIIGMIRCRLHTVRSFSK